MNLEKENNLFLKEGERIDDLERNGYKIIQDRKRFCFGMDAVLLLGFAQVKENEKVLDMGTGTGIIPILLEAKTVGEDFYALEIQQDSADMAKRSVILNHLEEKIDFVQADVFDYLDELKENEFDIIVLDPPAFTKSRRTVQKAYNGYKRINKQAMKVLKNGGYLITCSCSRFMETANFEKMLREAASEAGVVLKQVSVTQQNADHPILWTMEETSYLKFYIFQII